MTPDMSGAWRIVGSRLDWQVGRRYFRASLASPAFGTVPIKGSAFPDSFQSGQACTFS